jgi:hypothetical protein
MIGEIFDGRCLSSTDAMFHIWLGNNPISLWKIRNGMCFQEKQCGLGSCNNDAEKMATIAQRTAFAVDGQELQKGRITANCLAGLKTDAEPRQFFIDNTDWFLS